MEFAEFKKFLEENGKSENTVKTYCLAVRGYLNWYEESFSGEMQCLLRPNVLNYISYQRTVRGLINVSVNTHLAALQALNDFLIVTGVQADTVLTKADYLKVQVPMANPCVVSKAMVEAFRQKVLLETGSRNYAIITMMAYAGLRVSECLALRLTDVDLVSYEIKVRCGKGDKSRLIFVGDKVVNAVRTYLKDRPESDSPYLFLSRTKGKLDRSQVNRICNACSDVITPHQLRHFYCTDALEEGGYSIHEVANQAGHSNIHTTLIYTNPTREKMKEKANKL